MNRFPYTLQAHFDTSRPLMILVAGEEVDVRPDIDEYGEHFWGCYEGWLKWTEHGVTHMVNQKHIVRAWQDVPAEEEKP